MYISKLRSLTKRLARKVLQAQKKTRNCQIWSGSLNSSKYHVPLNFLNLVITCTIKHLTNFLNIEASSKERILRVLSKYKHAIQTMNLKKPLFNSHNKVLYHHYSYLTSLNHQPPIHFDHIYKIK